MPVFYKKSRFFVIFLNRNYGGVVTNIGRSCAHIMENKETQVSRTTEEELTQLLALLRVEPVAEADYEERFLANFHERIAREAVCRPARTLLWEHLKQVLANVGMRKWAYAASTCALTALVAVGIYAHQPEGAPLAVASVKVPTAKAAKAASSAEHSGFRLTPPSSRENFTCITVIREQRAPLTQNHRAMNGAARFFETNVVVAAETPQDVFSANMGLMSEAENSVFSVSTPPVFE